MNLNTISMDQDAAAQAFREYRAEWLKHRNQIDGELVKGYKALSEGKTLISLTEAFASAGRDAEGLPRIAVNRADEPFVLLDQTRENMVFYNGQRRHRLVVDVRSERSCWNMRAIAPIIPPKYRPPFGLANYHLLWEVQRWEQARRPAPTPRRDPALLKHIGGDLYAVLAVWDLTELESRILGLLRQ